jgi:hypothetical protein
LSAALLVGLEVGAEPIDDLEEVMETEREVWKRGWCASQRITQRYTSSRLSMSARTSSLRLPYCSGRSWLVSESEARRGMVWFRQLGA